MALSIVISSCDDNLETIRTRFGTDLDAERARLHMVVVGTNFTLVENKMMGGRMYMFINKSGKDVSTPSYLRKLVMLDTSLTKISFEEDYYTNPAEEKDLVIKHDYLRIKTTLTLYTKNEISDLDASAADSILRTWKTGFNPFN